MNPDRGSRSSESGFSTHAESPIGVLITDRVPHWPVCPLIDLRGPAVGFQYAPPNISRLKLALNHLVEQLINGQKLECDDYNGLTQVAIYKRWGGG